MAKRIKFNVQDLLFPEQHDANAAERIKLLMASPLLPAIAQIYNQSDKTVRVGKMTQNLDLSLKNVNLVNRLGFLVGTLNKGGNQLSIYSPWGPDCQFADRRMLTTANPRYLTNMIKMDSEHIASSNLHSAIREANIFIGSRLRNILDQLIDKHFGSSVTSVPQFKAGALSDMTATHIARVVAGEITLAEVPAIARQDFDRVYGAFKESRGKFMSAIAQGREFLDSEKWVYFPNINEGVVLGAINPEPMFAALDAYSNGGHLPFEGTSHSYVKETVPFKWYKSFDCIPEELRSGLGYSLVMLKMHRASEDLIPKEDGVNFWHEMGCYTYNPTMNNNAKSPMWLLAR